MKRITVALIAAVVFSGWLAVPAQAEASPFGLQKQNKFWKQQARWNHSKHRRDTCSLSRYTPLYKTIRIIVRGANYEYNHGRFYRDYPTGYVSVPAPVGAVVSSLPAEGRTVVIDGVVYHEYDGVYYKGGPVGYTVVEAPVANPGIKIAKTRDDYRTAAEDLESLTINVPNANGSYMPIELQAAKDGTYIGPNGEVYATKPTMDQLAAMYAQ